jgi:DNA polymerase-1
MTLLRGSQALAAAQTFSTLGPVAVAINPQARAGGSLQLLAMGNTEVQLLIDVPATPSLGKVFAELPVLCADAAKQVHSALLRTYGRGPQRWGCVQLCEALLQGGREAQLGAAAVAQRHGLGPLPAVDAGFTAMQAHVAALAQLLQLQGRALQRADLSEVSRLEAAAVAPVAAMELHGMPFDAPRWRTLAVQNRQEMQDLQRSLHAHLLAHLPPEKKPGPTLLGPAALSLNTDAELLQALRACGLQLPNLKRRSVAALPAPWGSLLPRYRLLQKLTQSYGEAFLAHVQADGRVHPTFEQMGASTGRMACHSPNLQAMVKGTAHRKCFACPPGRSLVIADYQACELRILAEMSRDPVFLAAFARGDDLHACVATLLFGKTVSKASHPQLRDVAKVVSFGLAYGMGTGGLAQTLKIDPTRAQHLLQRYNQKFPRIAGYLTDSSQAALQQRCARTLAGRRLYLDTEAFMANPAAAQRVAKNMPIQGTNADIIKIALARIAGALQSFTDAVLVNCIHDEVLVECRTEDAAAVEQVVVGEMVQAGAVLLKEVPLAVDSQIRTAWGHD